MDLNLIEKVLTNAGIPGIITYLVWIAFNKYFEYYKDVTKEERDIKRLELQKENEDIKKLCEKIDKMSDAIASFTVMHVQKTVIVENHIEDMKATYVKISEKQETIKQQVESINIRTKLCPNVKNVE